MHQKCVCMFSETVTNTWSWKMKNWRECCLAPPVKPSRSHQFAKHKKQLPGMARHNGSLQNTLPLWSFFIIKMHYISCFLNLFGEGGAGNWNSYYYDLCKNKNKATKQSLTKKKNGERSLVVVVVAETRNRPHDQLSNPPDPTETTKKIRKTKPKKISCDKFSVLYFLHTSLYHISFYTCTRNHTFSPICVF